MGIEALLRQVRKHLSQDDLELIKRAYEVAAEAHAGQIRASGEPYIHHPLAVAQILAELGLDGPTIAAGLLHDVAEDSLVSLEDLRQEFGEVVANLVDGVTKMGTIGEWKEGPRNLEEAARAESLRKMFLAMVEDVRVVLIKLADRLHNMRTLDALPEEKRRRIAKETLEIFSPLANRLGIWRIKRELDDLSFLHLYPRRYEEIAASIAKTREEREHRIAWIIETLRRKLREEGIEAEISGRPKHLYSIYMKMKRKGVPFDRIYDVEGVRIIVNSINECYTALGVVHRLWKPIPGEFDDYIANPKDNMYQSLHTSVIGPDGKPLEVQIRTHEMHRRAEYGVAAHWRYKERVEHDEAFEAKLAWLRSLMEWRRDLTDAREFIASVKSDVLMDRVYAFTPKGDVIDLPAGSTPIDFAYYIHTEIGHRCRGAEVNGRIVPLNYQLKNGDRVRIITGKREGPSRDWLNPQLGYVKTSRARQKIRRWFKQQDRAQNIAQGRELLERELNQLGVEKSYEEIAKLFGFDNVDDFLAAVGWGDINSQQIAVKVMEIERGEEKSAELAPPTLSAEGIVVQGVGNLLTHIARCCSPLPGQEIIGYITRGRGVTIHRKDCPNILYLKKKDEGRLIEVSWGRAKQTYPVMIEVKSYDRMGLMRDISEIVANEGINISAAHVITDSKDHIATITATLDITSAAQLSRVLSKIRHLPNVFEARRRKG